METWDIQRYRYILYSVQWGLLEIWCEIVSGRYYMAAPGLLGTVYTRSVLYVYGLRKCRG